MAKKPEKRPSFFKILSRTDFNRLLSLRILKRNRTNKFLEGESNVQHRLPRKFIEKYRSNLQKKVKLRIESGKTWDVKVESMENGLFFFSRGWNNFAEDVGLKFGEFLVFMLNDGGLFLDVSIYQTNGCKREFPAVCTIARKSSFEKNMGNNPLYYEFDLNLHHRSRITPKRTFARAANLMGKEGIEVVGEHHKQWIALDHGLKDALRVDMTRGWNVFRIANGLDYGKTYSFEFKPEQNVIKVKEVKD